MEISYRIVFDLKKSLARLGHEYMSWAEKLLWHLYQCCHFISCEMRKKLKVKSPSVNINLLSSSRRCQNAKWKFWNPLSFDSQKLFNGVLMTTMINDTLITLTYPNINVTSVLEFSEQNSTGSIFFFNFQLAQNESEFIFRQQKILMTSWMVS